MCLIVDVNIAHKVFLATDNPDFKDVHKALFTDNKPIASIVYGGKLVDEYARNSQIIRVLAQLDRTGRARKVDDDLIRKEMETVVQINLCQSNDEHIIALARIGKVRVLCSHDKALHTDFTNKKLIDKPRGKVYQKSKHVKLLWRFCN